MPVRRALERDEAAVAVWKDQVWRDIKAPRATWAPTSASRMSRPGAEAAEGTHLGTARRAAGGAGARCGWRAGVSPGWCATGLGPAAPVYKVRLCRRRKGSWLKLSTPWKFTRHRRMEKAR